MKALGTKLNVQHLENHVHRSWKQMESQGKNRNDRLLPWEIASADTANSNRDRMPVASGADHYFSILLSNLTTL